MMPTQQPKYIDFVIDPAAATGPPQFLPKRSACQPINVKQPDQ
jgi:hypothetical protein